MRYMVMAAALLAGCQSGTTNEAANASAEIPIPSGPPAPQEPTGEAPASGAASTQPGLSWESAAAGGGNAIRLISPDGTLLMSVNCLAGPARLVVNVPRFTPIGSEDRFAFAFDDDPITLVADPTRQTAGVTAEGPIPRGLAEVLERANSVTALYGTQQVGPHIPPPPELGRAFAEACDKLR